MTTILEHHFHFSADDLASNQLGELSERQRKQHQKRLRLHWKTMVVSILVTLIVSISLLVDSGEFREVLLVIIAIPILASNPLKTIKQVMRFFAHRQSKSVEGIYNVHKNDFVTVEQDSMPFYEVNADNHQLIITQRQWEILDTGSTYDFYYSPRHQPSSNTLISSILSVHQHSGLSPQLSTLEHEFDFLQTDIGANRENSLSQDQKRRIMAKIYANRNETRSSLIEVAVSLVTECALIAIALIWDIQLVLLCLVPLTVVMVVIYILVFLIQHWTNRNWKQALDSDKIEQWSMVKKQQFKLQNPMEPSKHLYKYQLKSGGVNFVLNVNQYTALNEGHSYNFYYFPPADATTIHTILAVEKLTEQPT